LVFKRNFAHELKQLHARRALLNLVINALETYQRARPPNLLNHDVGGRKRA
jgi:hypothetical protein